jgi:hypothetical protein
MIHMDDNIPEVNHDRFMHHDITISSFDGQLHHSSTHEDIGYVQELEFEKCR